MSFWQKLLGKPQNDKQIIKESEHELATRPSDDLINVEQKPIEDKNTNFKQEESNLNKSSPH